MAMNKALILGHRGASAYAPENTIIAFKRAFELGADGIELDVALTKDGAAIVMHDDKVDRTSNGKGVVSEMTLAEIQKLDAGSWFDAKFRGARFHTLDEAIDALPDDKLINIELKTRALRSWPPGRLPLSARQKLQVSFQMLTRLYEPSKLEETVVRIVKEAHAENRVIVSSFNPIALWRVKNLNPALPRGLLYFKELPIVLGRAWLRPLARPHALHPRNTTITPQLAQWAIARGYQINTWTVDDVNEAKRLVSLGIHALITNKPDVLRDAVQ
jgi:glycerophosphoryl diester phosphodiesterase